jgi:hypothetical protein
MAITIPAKHFTVEIGRDIALGQDVTIDLKPTGTTKQYEFSMKFTFLADDENSTISPSKPTNPAKDYGAFPISGSHIIEKYQSGNVIFTSTNNSVDINISEINNETTKTGVKVRNFKVFKEEFEELLADFDSDSQVKIKDLFTKHGVL